MILSDASIAEHIDDGKIVVEPDIEPEQIQPASLDIRLGPERLNPANGFAHKRRDETVKFEPGVAYIGHTLDYIELPNDIAAFLTGRSSVGRRGLIIHKTAGWIDPGFCGQIRLEVFNFSTEEISFDVGERIGQLVFFKLDRPSSGYEGQYQGQTGVTE